MLFCAEIPVATAVSFIVMLHESALSLLSVTVQRNMIDEVLELYPSSGLFRSTLGASLSSMLKNTVVPVLVAIVVEENKHERTR